MVFIRIANRKNGSLEEKRAPTTNATSRNTHMKGGRDGKVRNSDMKHSSGPRKRIDIQERAQHVPPKKKAVSRRVNAILGMTTRDGKIFIEDDMARVEDYVVSKATIPRVGIVSQVLDATCQILDDNYDNDSIIESSPGSFFEPSVSSVFNLDNDPTPWLVERTTKKTLSNDFFVELGTIQEKEESDGCKKKYSDKEDSNKELSNPTSLANVNEKEESDSCKKKYSDKEGSNKDLSNPVSLATVYEKEERDCIGIVPSDENSILHVIPEEDVYVPFDMNVTRDPSGTPPNSTYYCSTRKSEIHRRVDDILIMTDDSNCIVQERYCYEKTRKDLSNDVWTDIWRDVWTDVWLSNPTTTGTTSTTT